ncbi:hypothetical protein BLA29_009761, partial [Euroglyphus maynei]
MEYGTTLSSANANQYGPMSGKMSHSISNNSGNYSRNNHQGQPPPPLHQHLHHTGSPQNPHGQHPPPSSSSSTLPPHSAHPHHLDMNYNLRNALSGPTQTQPNSSVPHPSYGSSLTTGQQGGYVAGGLTQDIGSTSANPVSYHPPSSQSSQQQHHHHQQQQPHRRAPVANAAGSLPLNYGPPSHPNPNHQHTNMYH